MRIKMKQDYEVVREGGGKDCYCARSTFVVTEETGKLLVKRGVAVEIEAKEPKPKVKPHKEPAHKFQKKSTEKTEEPKAPSSKR